MRFRTNYLLPTVLAACLLFAGCYQARITTDKSPGDRVVQEQWAPSYLNGLVPATIDVSDECPNGIASAERNIPFANGLVSTLTLGIYLPQNVTVTCAAGGSMSSARPPSEASVFLRENATKTHLRETISGAVAESSTQTVTVYLQSD